MRARPDEILAQVRDIDDSKEECCSDSDRNMSITEDYDRGRYDKNLSKMRTVVGQSPPPHLVQAMKLHQALNIGGGQSLDVSELTQF